MTILILLLLRMIVPMTLSFSQWIFQQKNFQIFPAINWWKNLQVCKSATVWLIYIISGNSLQSEGHYIYIVKMINILILFRGEGLCIRRSKLRPQPNNFQRPAAESPLRFASAHAPWHQNSITWHYIVWHGINTQMIMFKCPIIRTATSNISWYHTH